MVIGLIVARTASYVPDTILFIHGTVNFNFGYVIFGLQTKFDHYGLNINRISLPSYVLLLFKCYISLLEATTTRKLLINMKFAELDAHVS